MQSWPLHWSRLIHPLEFFFYLPEAWTDGKKEHFWNVSSLIWHIVTLLLVLITQAKWLGPLPTSANIRVRVGPIFKESPIFNSLLKSGTFFLTCKNFQGELNLPFVFLAIWPVFLKPLYSLKKHLEDPHCFLTQIFPNPQILHSFFLHLQPKQTHKASLYLFLLFYQSPRISFPELPQWSTTDWGGLHNRTVLSHSPGSYKSKTEFSAFPEGYMKGLLFSCGWSGRICWSLSPSGRSFTILSCGSTNPISTRHSPCAVSKFPSFYKDTNHIGWGHIPKTSSELGYICKNPIFKEGHTLRHWELVT